jgi:hemerythrin
MRWDESLSVGIDAIDNQHREFVDCVSDLERAQALSDRDGVGRVIKRVINFASTHFAFEEELMERGGYKLRAHHKAAHDDFVRRMREYARRHAQGEDVARRLLSELNSWTTNHMDRDDKDYARSVRPATKESWMSRARRVLANS